MKLNRFTVIGRGMFPIDMLRYDCCWPASDIAVSNIFVDEEDAEKIREVTLYTYEPSCPTVARWESFGWRVKTNIITPKVRRN